MFYFVIFGLTVFFTALPLVKCNCIWYGDCKPTLFGQKPCVYHGPGKKLSDDEAINLIHESCIDALEILGPKNETCCDASQVRQMTKIFDTLSRPFLSRCPSCYFSFTKLFCYMSCSSNQDKFLEITGTEKNDKGQLTLSSFRYYVSHMFAYGMYNSCSEVQASALNQPAIWSMCGIFGSTGCTPEKLLNFLGTYAPASIDFKVKDAPTVSKGKTYHPMNESFIPCSKPYKKGGSACGCGDCPSAEQCQAAPLPPPKQVWKIGGIDGMYVVAISLFAGFLLILIIGIIFKRFRKKKYEGGDDDGPKMATGCRPCLRSSDCSGPMDQFLYRTFFRIGRINALHPFISIAVTSTAVISLSIGILYLKIDSDAVNMWSSKDSRARLELDYFNEHFGPFYRTTQVFITNKNPDPISYKNRTYGPVFHLDFLKQVLDLQSRIQDLRVQVDGSDVTLSDICFKPMAPDYEECAIMSPLNYFQNNLTNLEMESNHSNYLDHLNTCVYSMLEMSDKMFFNESCFGTYGGPVFPFVALGGFAGKDDYLGSTALVINILINNHLDVKDLKNATTWEKKFIEMMKSYENENVSVAFMAFSSPQSELNREIGGQIVVAVLSYVVMFVYVAVALGEYRKCNTFMVDAKVSLAIGGVVLVLLSISSTIGLLSYFGVSTSLIIIEVLPLLLLAVGVDNIFIIVKHSQRHSKDPDERHEDYIGRIVGQVGPSIMLSSMAEATCFLTGILSSMPAVSIFALYSGVAVLINFLLQLNCFVAFLSLDVKRHESQRMDLCCCNKPDEEEELNLIHNDGARGGFLYRLFRDKYAPNLMKSVPRCLVALVFVCFFCLSLAVFTGVKVGMDLAETMPKDSYMLKFFDCMDRYAECGAPVYFIVPEGYDYTKFDRQNHICSSFGCDTFSLVSQLSTASRRSNRTYLRSTPSSWIDNYFDWTSSPACCRQYTNGSFCPSTDTKSHCHKCDDVIVKHRPKTEKFVKYLQYFLNDNPNSKVKGACTKGGHPSFKPLVELRNGTIGATAFMQYQSALKSPKDYIDALYWSRQVAGNITRTLSRQLKQQNVVEEFKVFPYSYFNIFYEQYLNIREDSERMFAISLASISLVTFILTGFDHATTLIIIICVSMIIVEIVSVMYWWNISLNAVSLVNLIMSIGISVEFCSHVARAFVVSSKDSRVQRAEDALANVGSSVFSGITLTKFFGIVVLGFSKLQMMKIYYFRMYLCLVLIGASHGLVFLPVLLSLCGPGKKMIKSNKDKIINDPDTGEI